MDEDDVLNVQLLLCREITRKRIADHVKKPAMKRRDSVEMFLVAQALQSERARPSYPFGHNW